jgi:hypothetical protein
LGIRNNKGIKTRKFYETLLKRHKEAEEHPEELVPLEEA